MEKNYRDPESQIERLVRKGDFKEIARKAIRHSWSMGLPVTVVEEGVLYRVMPDGGRIYLKEVEPARMKYRKGQIFAIKAAS